MYQSVCKQWNNYSEAFFLCCCQIFYSNKFEFFLSSKFKEDVIRKTYYFSTCHLDFSETNQDSIFRQTTFYFLHFKTNIHIRFVNITYYTKLSTTKMHTFKQEPHIDQDINSPDILVNENFCYIKQCDSV